MKHSNLARLLPWLLITVCPPLLGHCGGAVEHGTETGNPPVVEQQKLHIVLGDRGVEVVGEAGAVSPGASVTVTNRTTGAHVAATAGADGSVDVVVPGSLQDEYEVTVSNGAGSQTVQITAQASDMAGAGGSASAGGAAGSASTGGAAGDGGAGGDTMISMGPDPAVCDALQQTLYARVSDGFASVDRACQRDEDCTFANPSTGCAGGCPVPIASVASADTARAAIARDIAPLCDEISNAGCVLPPPECPVTGGLACDNGTCTTLATPSDCGELTATATKRRNDAIETASRTCSRDDDCALTQARVSCVASCPNIYYSVASSALEQLTTTVTQTEGLYCTLAQSRGCPGPVPLPCAVLLETPQAICTAGQCDVTFVLPP